MVICKTRTLIRAAVAVLAIAASAMSAHGQTTNYKENQARVDSIARVVARVTDVWVRDSRYEVFQKELSDKYTGTPPLDRFVADEQWVVVISSTSVMYPGIFKGRGKTSLDLKRGDIVEMSIASPTNVKSYDGLSTIQRIICKADSADYADCAKSNPLTWLDAGGKKIEAFR
jgi:hypothetical protein